MTVDVEVEYAEHGTIRMKNHFSGQICVAKIAK